MSHHVYTTRGLVLRLRPQKESDRLASIFTRDLGFVTGTARGARSPLSKLSPTLLQYSLVKVSLVKGKHSWRVTTVTLLRDISVELRGRKQALKTFAQTLSLVEKLVRGEEKNSELYDELERAALILLDEVGDDDLDAWELLTVAKILYHLGYLSREALPSTIAETKRGRKVLLQVVNAGIKESGLR